MDPRSPRPPLIPGRGVDENLEELYQEAPCGYLSSLVDGTIVSVNRTFLEWTGYTESDLIGRHRIQDLLTRAGRIYHETHYAPMLRMQGSVREVALDVVCADGRTLPVLINSLVRSASDPPVVRTVVIDATERRGYEEELVRAKRAAEDAEARARLLARTLQASLIPPALPVIPGLEIASSYRPSGDGSEVGGDFFDVFALGERRWGLVIGDVQGKGAEAATVTALARYTVRAAAVQDPSPRRVLGTLNQALLMDPVERFCTVGYAVVEPPREPAAAARVCLASAGHPLPLHARPGQQPAPVGQEGILVGAFADGFRVEETVVDLPRGDLLVWFTDGLPEARSAGRFLGDEGVRAALERLSDASPAEVAQGLTEHALAFQGGAARDDIAVVVLRIA